MSTQNLRGARILVVEDEALIALDLTQTLSAHGAIVAGPCQTLSAALEAARQADIDLAVLDIDLAGNEVYPAARILRERGIPFLFQTGRTARATLQGEFAGVPVCAKPVTPGDLLGRLTLLLGLAA